MTTSLNDRIALAKGWTWIEKGERRIYRTPTPARDIYMEIMCHWRKPDGELISTHDRPDYVNTLEGVAGMLLDLGSEWAWGWYHGDWACFEKNHKTLDVRRKLRSFFSPNGRPSDCVAEAWLSVFGKKAAHAV